MKTEVKFTRRYTTDVNYEYEEYTVTAQTEDVAETLGELKTAVEEAHAGVESEGSKKVTKVKAEKADTTKGPKSAKKAPAKKVEEDDEDEDSDDDETDGNDVDDDGDDDELESDSGDDDDESDSDDDTDEEDEEPKKKVVTRNSASKAPAKKVAGKKKAGTNYDRANDTHKKLMAEEIKTLSPKFFASKPNQEKARTISKKLHGSEFLDSDGQVVASFKKALSTAVKAK